MKRAHAIGTQLGLASTLAVAAIVGCDSAKSAETTEHSSNALGTCGPSERPDNVGGCEPCPPLVTQASIAGPEVQNILDIVGVQNASYSITNGVGTFSIAGTSLPMFGFKAPTPSLLALPPIDGSFPLTSLVSIPYTAYPSIPNLTLTWGDWLVGASGVTIQAQLSGEIDIHISADPLVVDPALHLSGLPVTITFGADWTGDATILPSQVVVASVGDYSDISGCGALGWCDGLFSSQIDGKVQSQLQSQLHDQFLIALNGQSDAGPPPSPFWIGFLTAVANSPLMQPTDPADNPLPKPDAGQPGGITSSWQCVGDVVLTSNGVSASFQSSAGLCFIDCTPKTAQQLCSQPNPCAQMNDGCGDLVACPGVCDGPGDTCYDNQCQVCVPQTCASRGIECGSMSTGCGYAIDCGGCPNGAECNANGQCVGGRGAGKGCFGKTCM